jgi:hypothetical protein
VVTHVALLANVQEAMPPAAPTRSRKGFRMNSRQPWNCPRCGRLVPHHAITVCRCGSPRSDSVPSTGASGEGISRRFGVWHGGLALVLAVCVAVVLTRTYGKETRQAAVPAPQLTEVQTTPAVPVAAVHPVAGQPLYESWSSPSGPAEVAVETADQDGLEYEPEEDEPQDLAQAWRERRQEARNEVTRLSTEVDRLQALLNDMSGLYGGARAKKIDQLNSTKERLGAAQRTVDALEDEARQKGYR